MFSLHLHPDLAIDLHNQHLEELRADARRAALVRRRGTLGRKRLVLRGTRERIAARRHAIAG